VIGEIVGNYRILSLIGEGGMGVVYLAEHPGMGRRAAVKVLHAGLAQNSEIATRFFNEARAANAVRHPGIVEVFDLGTLPSGATYIIMEFLEGESLAARLRRGPLSATEAVDIAAQTADALGAAHAKGIVHRDLKPDNLFLVSDPREPGRTLVKVLDFGIAKLTVEAPGSGSVRTRTGTVMGTPLYMSPEQCRGTREVDLRTDIYALGVILYELVCGRPPFISQGQGELIHMHIAVAPTPPRSLNPGVSPALERVILAALEKDPAARTQTMSDFLRGLRAAGAASSPAEGRATPPAASGPSTTGSVAQSTFSATASALEMDGPRARPARWPLVALLGAVAVGGAAFALRSTGHSSAEHAPSQAAPTASPAPAPPAVAPAPPPAPKIAVSIASQPAGARVVRERDGADIGVTPFEESWPAGTGVEKIHLELEGYQPESLVVPLDRGVALKFALTKVARETEKKPKAPKPHAPRRAAPAPSGPSEPVPL
jgi:serine/threonine-protein kinase